MRYRVARRAVSRLARRPWWTEPWWGPPLEARRLRPSMQEPSAKSADGSRWIVGPWSQVEVLRPRPRRPGGGSSSQLGTDGGIEALSRSASWTRSTIPPRCRCCRAGRVGRPRWLAAAVSVSSTDPGGRSSRKGRRISCRRRAVAKNSCSSRCGDFSLNVLAGSGVRSSANTPGVPRPGEGVEPAAPGRMHHCEAKIEEGGTAGNGPAHGPADRARAAHAAIRVQLDRVIVGDEQPGFGGEHGRRTHGRGNGLRGPRPAGCSAAA